MDLNVAAGAFDPRHSTPISVWELSVGALASDDFCKSLTCLIAYPQQHKSDAIKIEPHRMGPTGLRQACGMILRPFRASALLPEHTGTLIEGREL